MLRAQRIALGASVAAVFLVVASVALVTSYRHSKQDQAIRAQAEQLERQKDWPAAIASFGILAGSHRSLAKFGGDNAARLKAQLEKERLLLQQARDREAAGDLSGGRQIYQQLADLHGDQEQNALTAIGRLDALVNSTAPPIGAESRHENTASGAHSAVQRAVQETPKSTPKCQLDPADIPMRVDRAASEDGKGEYEHAKQLYEEVLACEPTNKEAIRGLAKTKKGQQTQQHLRPSDQSGTNPNNDH